MGIFGPPNVEKMKASRNIKGLIKAIGYEKDPEVAKHAAEALVEIRETRAVKPLIGALGDEREEVAQTAADVLARFGKPAVKELVAALESEKDAIRQGTRDVLITIGKPAVNELIGALKNKDESICIAIANILSRIGEPAEGPLIDVAAGTKKNPIRVRLVAMRILLNINPFRAVEPLGVMLRDNSSTMREAAVSALGGINDSRTVHLLIKALGDEKKAVNQPAVKALKRIGESVIEDLIAAVTDTKNPVRVRLAVMRILLNINPFRAVEPLGVMLRDKSPTVREAAVSALDGINDSRTVHLLIKALGDNRIEVRSKAAKFLHNMGWKPEEYIDKVNYLIAIENGRCLLKLGGPAVESLVDKIDNYFKGLGLFGFPSAESANPDPPFLFSYTEKIAALAKDAATFKHKDRPGIKYDAGYVCLKKSNKAIEDLCKIKCPTTSNVLNLVAHKQDISIHMDSGCREWEEEVNFQVQRNTAKDELKRRGNPPYRPEAYLLNQEEDFDDS